MFVAACSALDVSSHRSGNHGEGSASSANSTSDASTSGGANAANSDEGSLPARGCKIVAVNAGPSPTNFGSLKVEVTFTGRPSKVIVDDQVRSTNSSSDPAKATFMLNATSGNKVYKVFLIYQDGDSEQTIEGCQLAWDESSLPKFSYLSGYRNTVYPSPGGQPLRQVVNVGNWLFMMPAKGLYRLESDAPSGASPSVPPGIDPSLSYTQFVADGNMIVALTAGLGGGLLAVSTDGGNSFVMGKNPKDAYDVSFTPNKIALVGQTILAQASPGHFLLSKDAGKTWSTFDIPPATLAAVGGIFTFSRTNTGNVLFIGQNANLIVSPDFTTMAVKPKVAYESPYHYGYLSIIAKPDILYSDAATGGGASVSIDGGETFMVSLSTSCPEGAVDALKHGHEVFIICQTKDAKYSTTLTYLYSNQDGAALQSETMDLGYSHSNGNAVFVGDHLMLAADNAIVGLQIEDGKLMVQKPSWTAVGLLKVGDAWILCTDEGLLRSVDQGEHFTQMNSRFFEDANETQVSNVPSYSTPLSCLYNGGSIYINFLREVFQSTDGGLNFVRQSPEGNNKYASRIAVSGEGILVDTIDSIDLVRDGQVINSVSSTYENPPGGFLEAFDNYVYVHQPDGLLVSTDGGLSFSKNAYSGSTVPDSLYWQDGSLWGAVGSFLGRSKDHGATFDTYNVYASSNDGDGAAAQIDIWPKRDGLYVSGDKILAFLVNGGFAVSRDAGKSFLAGLLPYEIGDYLKGNTFVGVYQIDGKVLMLLQGSLYEVSSL